MRSRITKLPVTGLLATAAAAIAASFLFSGNANANATVLRLSTHVTEQDFRYEAFMHFKKLVADGTKGRVNVQIFTTSSLHPFAKAIDASLGGVADIVTVVGAAADDRLPCTAATHFMPAQTNTPKVYELHRAYNALMKDEFDKLGLEVLFSFDFGYDQEWLFRKEVARLDKLEGRLVRSVGPFSTSAIETFGGKAVYIAPAETYQSAERGVVDGLNMGIATITSWKMWEVMPHLVRSNMFYGNILYPISKKKMASMSPADQDVVRQSAVKMIEWAQPRYERWIQQQIGEAVIKNGVSVKTLTKAETQQLVEKVRSAWMPKVEAACGPEKTKRLLDLFRKYSG
jgi:TRAP-type transport system periplasmic protein